MSNLPQEKEMIIQVPKAMERYFYELVAGSACIVTATVIALTMMYQVMDSTDPDWLRMTYFLIIALSLVVLILGFRIVMDSEAERPLAAKYAGREWVMDDAHLSISLALLEGKERITLRKFKTGAVRLEWQDITRIVYGSSSKKLSKTTPACIEIYVENHEDTLGFNAVLRIRRKLLIRQESHIIAFCRAHGVKVEIADATTPAPPPSAPKSNAIPFSQSVG